jgi:hypothetical protein
VTPVRSHFGEINMPIDMLHDRKEKKNVCTIGFVQLYIISQHESPRVLRASVVVFKKKIGRENWSHKVSSENKKTVHPYLHLNTIQFFTTDCQKEKKRKVERNY